MAFNPDPGKKIVLLFWNLDDNPLVDPIYNLVEEHAVDVLLLAESPFRDRPDDLLQRLAEISNLSDESPFTQPEPADEQRVQVFTRLHRAEWAEITKRSRYTIWSISLSGARRFILATAHFPSIQEDQNDGQRECGLALRLDLEKAEADLKNQLSIIIGDLNAHPFDAGIAGIYGLNGTQSRRVAQSSPRELNGRQYPWLFNPMWRFLGTDIPGTFYKRLSAPVCYDWCLLDQVLVRPGLIRLFDNETKPDVAILTQARNMPLARPETRIPNKEAYSGHLPLLFRFYLPEE